MKKLILILAVAVLAVPIAAMAGESAKGEIKPAPWSGDWWSRKKGFLVKGWPGHTPSPFERYDRYVETRTGKNPGAWAWESNVKNNHYNPNAADWEGHCNGWAAASVMAPEPRMKRTRNGVVFETADQKAILSEQYMNTYCNFFGTRYWGSDNDYDDIYPDEFHRLLLKYIGEGKSAMICDVQPGAEVWNFPLYKFESSWSTGWFDSNKLKVTTKVYYADDGVKPDFLGTKWFTTTYTYNLIVDDDGNVIRSEWTGDSRKNHPDFVWIPMSDSPNPPGGTLENPNIDPKFVKEITQGDAVIDIPRGAPTPDSILVEAGLNPAELF